MASTFHTITLTSHLVEATNRPSGESSSSIIGRGDRQMAARADKLVASAVLLLGGRPLATVIVAVCG